MASDIPPLRVLVCGSRRVSGAARVYERLGQLPPNTIIIEGGQRGIDRQAREISKERGWPYETFEANWKKHGKAAGPLRNKAMVDSHPDLVLAFPDYRSIGTWGCVALAKAAGIPVEVIHV